MTVKHYELRDKILNELDGFKTTLETLQKDKSFNFADPITAQTFKIVKKALDLKEAETR